MKTRKRTVLPILVSGIWVNISEFFRNEVLVKSHWVEHFQGLGLDYPSNPIIAVIWLIWGFVFAGIILALTDRFNLIQTTLLGWIAGFFLMWMVTWNLSVLPLGILWIAVPLSLLEVLVCAFLCRKLAYS